jgi:hypothetical protein
MIRCLAAVAVSASVAATGCTSTAARVVTTPAAGQHHASNAAATSSLNRGTVESASSAGGTTYRLVYRHTGCPGPCHPVLESAPTGTSRWTMLRRVPSGFGAAVSAGGSLVVVTIFGHTAGGEPSAHTGYLISSDGGSTWRRRSDPCGGRGMGEWDTTRVAVSGHSIAAMCQRRLAPPRYAVVVSSDSGRTFTSRRPVSAQVARGGAAWLAAQVAGR